MQKRRKERILAMQALYCWDVTQESLEKLTTFNWLAEKHHVHSHDFALELICGAIEKHQDLDLIIEKNLVNWSIDRLDKVDLAILRMSVYELLYMDTPYTIAIDEGVEIAKYYSGEQSPGFINGILDSIAKKRKVQPKAVK